MKNMKLFVSALALTAISATVNAQSTATASTTATVITPIAISKTTDMNFGNIATNGTAGTVVLDATNGRTYTGGVTLPSSTGTVTSAVFSVSGDANRGFSISIPSSITLTGSTSQATMTVDNFVSSLGASSTLDELGAATINIGATLNVPTNVVADTYTNASDLAVTVNYN